MANIKEIQVIRIGNIVKISLGGKLHSKNCGSSLEADELMKITMKAKENPSDENVKAVKGYLNENTRIAMLAGLENDPDTGEVFLAGFNTAIPDKLVEVIKDYFENSYPLKAIINFWKLLMINIDTRVRKSLFDFISKHDFVLTDKGYMVVYKAVYYKDEARKSELAEFVSNQYFHVKKDWQCSPNKYAIYQDTETGVYAITKIKTALGWGWNSEVAEPQNLEALNINVLGKLGDVYNNIFNNGEVDGDIPVYTDMWSKKMTIVLGQPVKMDRKDCNGDPQVECSYGLHCGATGYVNTYASSVQNGAGVVLACYVNPANVVAVPTADCTKMRVTEYFPFAVATYENGKIDIAEQQYFESDYAGYEAKEVQALIAKVKKGEKPAERAMNADEDTRPMSEMVKILETRLVELTA
jgi:hypothetical protein